MLELLYTAYIFVVGCLVISFLYCQTVPKECVLHSCYDEFWSGGTCEGGSLDVQWSILPVWWWTWCLLPCWDDEPFYFVSVWFYSLDDSGRFLCIVSLRDLWVPANLFLLHNWVITLVLRSLVRVAWFDWKWGHFKIYIGTYGLAFTLCFGMAAISYGLKYWRSRQSIDLVAWQLEHGYCYALPITLQCLRLNL